MAKRCGLFEPGAARVLAGARMTATAAAMSMVLPLAAMALGAGGCDQKLETGYVPQRLNASDADRRAYYAPPFSAPSKDEGGGMGGMPNLSHP